jgi:UDP-glucuronate 4-epimerase
MDAEMAYGIYNLGNSETTTLIELVRSIERATGVEAQLVFEPEQPGDPPHTSADISRARADLRFAPATPVSDGVQHFIDWLRRILELEAREGRPAGGGSA